MANNSVPSVQLLQIPEQHPDTKYAYTLLHLGLLQLVCVAICSENDSIMAPKTSSGSTPATPAPQKLTPKHRTYYILGLPLALMMFIVGCFGMVVMLGGWAHVFPTCLLSVNESA